MLQGPGARVARRGGDRSTCQGRDTVDQGLARALVVRTGAVGTPWNDRSELRVTMPTFTVHQPPPKPGETTSTPERFLFLRDGFHFWAFVLAPFWLLRYQLWVGFVVYLAGSAGIAVVLGVVRAPLAVEWRPRGVVGLLIGFGGGTIC